MNQNETIRFFSHRFMPTLLLVLCSFVLIATVFVEMNNRHLESFSDNKVTEFESVMGDCQLYNGKGFPKSVVYLNYNSEYVRSHDKEILNQAYDLTESNEKSSVIFRVFHYCSN